MRDISGELRVMFVIDEEVQLSDPLPMMRREEVRVTVVDFGWMVM